MSENGLGMGRKLGSRSRFPEAELRERRFYRYRAPNV